MKSFAHDSENANVSSKVLLTKKLLTGKYMKDYFGLVLIRSRKIIVVLSLLCFSVFTYALPAPMPVVEDHFSIGAGAAYNSSPFLGYNGFATPMPFFDIRYGNFFAKNNHDEPVIGFELFRHKRIMLAVAATRGRTFLDLDEINKKNEILYLGLEDRDQAVEAGLIFHFYSRVGLFEATAFHDMTSTYGGTRSSLSISRPFPETGNWEIVPRFFIKHYSEKFNNYYYGVTVEDNNNAEDDVIASGSTLADYIRITRPAYDAGNSGHVGVDLDIKYNFTESLSAVGYIAIEKFSGSVETSPLIEDKELVTTSLGLQYNF